jgi:hypothetical protein
VDLCRRPLPAADAEHGRDPDVLVRHVFAAALSRGPAPDEVAAARAILGDSPTDAQVADLLWAVVMLPEFQLVR